MTTRRIPLICIAALAAVFACTGGPYATDTPSDPAALPECTEYLAVYGPCLEQSGSATHAQVERHVADLREAYARVAADPALISDLRTTCQSKLTEMTTACPARGASAPP